MTSTPTIKLSAQARQVRPRCKASPHLVRVVVHRALSRVATTIGLLLATSVMAASEAGAASPDITPNTSGVPGIGSFRQIAGGLATAGLIASGVALIISAVVWAVASNSGNFHHYQKGKAGVLYSCGAALVIGSVNLIIGVWNNIGTALH